MGIPRGDSVTTPIIHGGLNEESGGQFMDVLRRKRKTYKKRRGSVGDGGKNAIPNCFNSFYKMQKPPSKQ
jgi:hypothetical protein